MWGIDWYRNEWPWVSFRGRLRSCEPLRHIRHWISRKPRLGSKEPPIGIENKRINNLTLRTAVCWLYRLDDELRLINDMPIGHWSNSSVWRQFLCQGSGQFSVVCVVLFARSAIQGFSCIDFAGLKLTQSNRPILWPVKQRIPHVYANIGRSRGLLALKLIGILLVCD